jgi:hypothetical protein
MAPRQASAGSEIHPDWPKTALGAPDGSARKIWSSRPPVAAWMRRVKRRRLVMKMRQIKRQQMIWSAPSAMAIRRSGTMPGILRAVGAMTLSATAISKTAAPAHTTNRDPAPSTSMRREVTFKVGV